MILSLHALFGAAIGTQIPDFWGALFLGIIFHYLLDKIPHYEYGIDKIQGKNETASNLIFEYAKVFGDLLFGLLIIFYFRNNFTLAQQLGMVGGIIGSLLPDGLLFISWQLKKIAKKYNIFTPIYQLSLIPYQMHMANHFDNKNKIPQLWWNTASSLFLIILIILTLAF